MNGPCHDLETLGTSGWSVTLVTLMFDLIGAGNGTAGTNQQAAPIPCDSTALFSIADARKTAKMWL